jgi:acyl-CoA hydrolase
MTEHLEAIDFNPPTVNQAVLTYRTGVGDANAAGEVHGGCIMKLCDDAAAIAASRHARRRVVTAAVDGMRFLGPVHLHDVVTLKAAVNAAWRSSMEVGVRVEAESLVAGETRHTVTAYLTMVALDGAGQPTPVPPLVPQTFDEKRRWRAAHLRRRIRLTQREQLHEFHGSLELYMASTEGPATEHLPPP